MTVLRGRGLHGGEAASVRLLREPGAVRFRRGRVEARIAELQLDGSRRSTVAATRDGRFRVATVEHLFAALGAFAVRDGVVIEIDGPEIPLLDGGARAFVDALRELGVARSPAPLRIVRSGTVDVGASRYELRVPERDETVVEVAVDFGDARLAPQARWEGDAEDFYDRIAPARTFGFEHELGELAHRGLASHVDPSSVVVIGAERVLSAGPAFTGDEPARHKLLDLVGDLYANGGPCVGTVRATRPGHAATHEAIARAHRDGLVMTTRTR